MHSLPLEKKTVRYWMSFLKEHLHTVMFIIVYSSFFLYASLGHISAIEMPFRYLRYLAAPLLAVLIVQGLKNVTKQTVCILIFIAALGILSKDANLIKIVILSLAAVGEDLRACIKFECKLRAAVIAGVVILYYLGIAPDMYAWGNGEIRHSMGFTNPNAFGLAVTILCMEFLYLRGMKINAAETIAILLLCKYVDVCSKSRTSILVILMSLVLAILNTMLPKVFKNVKAAACIPMLPAICGATTLLLIFLFSLGNGLAVRINAFISGRLAFPIVYLQECPISLFGMDTSAIGVTIDNAYIYTWITWGLIGFVFFVAVQTYMLKRCIAMDEIALLLVFICFTIFGLSERLWMNIDYNIFVLAYSKIILEEGCIESEKKNAY